MKKALYIWQHEYPWDVRTEKVCLALQKAGFAVTILARSGGKLPQFEIVDGLNIVRVGYGMKPYKSLPISWNPLWRMEIFKIIQKLKPDVVIPREIMLAEASAGVARKFNIPVVMDMAENYPAAMKDWKKYNKTALRRFVVHSLKIPDIIEKNAVANMDGIITVCSEQNDRLANQFKFLKENICVVHNTPDINLLGNIKESENTKPKVFMHHGYLSAEKSIETFLKGFLLATEKRNDIRMIIAGDGECFEDLQKLVNESGFSDRVAMTGKYDYSELNSIIEQSDIGVIPYQISDFNDYTIHNKIFDYFAASRPVIVSEAKPLARVVRDSGAGFVVDCSDPESVKNSILTIADMKMKKLNQKAKTAAQEKYNWECDSRNLIDFINKFI